MTRIKSGLQTILNAKTTTGAGVALDVNSYHEIGFQLYTSGNANATIKFAVSYSSDKPDFDSAASPTNVYDFVDITPLNNQATPVVGSTGIVLTGTDVVRLYTVDTRNVKWFCPIITARSAGTINCQMSAVNDYTR